VRLEGLGKLKKKKLDDFIVTRTRDLPGCSVVPQATTLPRAPNDYPFLPYYNEFIPLLHRIWNPICLAISIVYCGKTYKHGAFGEAERVTQVGPICQKNMAH
jgi:hypothetical protein